MIPGNEFYKNNLTMFLRTANQMSELKTKLDPVIGLGLQGYQRCPVHLHVSEQLQHRADCSGQIQIHPPPPGKLLMSVDCMMLIVPCVQARQMSIRHVAIVTTASLLVSLALSSPLMVVTKLEVMDNMFDKETSWCYEVRNSMHGVRKSFEVQ